MPLITACPECNTQFVVKKEQLRAFDGQVRCGTCQHVFNAKTYLIKSSRLKKVIVTKVEALLSEVSLNSEAPLDDAPFEDDITPIVTADALSDAAPNQQQPAETATPASLLISDTELTSLDQPVLVYEPTEAINIHSVIIEGSERLPTPEPSAGMHYSQAVAETGLLIESIPAQASSLEAERLSQNKANRPLKKNQVNWLGYTVCTGLVLALLSQILYFNRIAIAAYYPQTKPFLMSLCNMLGCKVALPNNIDFLTIDDSDMHEHLEYKEILVLTSTLINHAPYAQAYPTIELTLTNSSDEPVLRRTLTAKDYLAKDIEIAQGIPANAEIAIQLNLNTADLQVAGYRVALNY